MKQTLADILSSKKALAAMAGVVAYVSLRAAAHFHVALGDDLAQQIGDRVVALAMTYVAGQAVADHGKEAASVQMGGLFKMPPTP